MAYRVNEDPFYGQLRSRGDTIWKPWTHSKGLPGAAPEEMTRSVWTAP